MFDRASWAHRKVAAVSVSLPGPEAVVVGVDEAPDLLLQRRVTCRGTAGVAILIQLFAFQPCKLEVSAIGRDGEIPRGRVGVALCFRGRHKAGGNRVPLGILEGVVPGCVSSAAALSFSRSSW